MRIDQIDYRSKFSNHSLYQIFLIKLLLSWGKFRREPATTMVRLVFRPYAQIWRWICTSQSLRTSIRISSDFILFEYSSPSFGSQQISSNSNIIHKLYRLRLLSDFKPEFISITFISHYSFYHYNTRLYVRLLGPCFKTG